MLERPLPSNMPAQPNNNTPNSKRYYRPELDVLRFFAFLCVFCFHWMDYVAVDAKAQRFQYAIGTAGAFGVPVFSVLSSFLIVELLLRERQQKTGDVHIKSFYIMTVYFVFGRSTLMSSMDLPLWATSCRTSAPKGDGSWLAFNLVCWKLVH